MNEFDILVQLFTLGNNIRHAVSDKRDPLCVNGIDRLNGYCITSLATHDEYVLLYELLNKVESLLHKTNDSYQELSKSCVYIWELTKIEYDGSKYEQVPDILNIIANLIQNTLQSTTDDSVKRCFEEINKRYINVKKLYIKLQKIFGI